MDSLLEDNVLVLNKHFLAVKVCSVRSTITALYKGMIKVIDDNYSLYDYDGWVKKSLLIHADQEEVEKYGGIIHSPKHFIYTPQAIYLHASETSLKALMGIKYTRRNVFTRDNNICQYCNTPVPKKELTVDHVIPRSRGGKNTFTNIVTSCGDCNNRKADLTPEEAGMKLIRPPQTPRWKSHVGIPFSRAKKSYWNRFL